MNAFGYTLQCNSGMYFREIFVFDGHKYVSEQSKCFDGCVLEFVMLFDVYVCKQCVFKEMILLRKYRFFQ